MSDLIRQLLGEGVPENEVNSLAARIEAEAEREGMMLRNAPRRFASGGRRHTETKYDKIFWNHQSNRQKLRELGSGEDIPIPVSDTPIREILPERLPVQKMVERPQPQRPSRFKQRGNVKQFEKMRARRLGG